jgi:hypothetical protein
MERATHEQANLLLKLYELRREPRLREARKWFTTEFAADTAEEMMQKYPSGTEASVSYRMVLSYWDMACCMANRGLVDDEMFFETSSEFWFVWERVRPIVSGMREIYGNPLLYRQIESAAKRLEKWWDHVAPGLVDNTRKRMALTRLQTSSAAR